MKTNNIILSILVLFISSSLFAQTKETVKVWGNCEMCQKKIEGAAKDAGASSASWNSETKMLTVSYKEKKTSLSKIEEAIAGVGYDTQNFTASDEVYNKLPGCCQYDRKGATGATADSKSCCKDGTCGKDGKCGGCKDGACGKDGKCAGCKDGKCADCNKANSTATCGKDCKCGECKDGKCEKCHKGSDKGDHASADAGGKCSASCCKKG